MHWLAKRLGVVKELSDRFVAAKQKTLEAPSGKAQEQEARQAFVAALRKLVSEVAERSGVTAAFVAHDGLIFASAGDVPDFEALSGLAQVALAAGKRTATGLALGSLRQMVLIGDDHKLALFLVGQMAIGVLAPSTTDLSEVLRQ